MGRNQEWIQCRRLDHCTYTLRARNNTYLFSNQADGKSTGTGTGSGSSATDTDKNKNTGDGSSGSIDADPARVDEDEDVDDRSGDAAIGRQVGTQGSN